MKFWHRYGRYIPLFLTLMLLLAGCEPSALNPVGKNAKMQGDLMLLSVGVMSLVILVVIVIFFYVLIRFRKRKDDDSIPEQVEGNTKLEITWTVIPIILLAILAVPMVYQVFALADTNPTAHEKKHSLTIDVTAHQYWWDFDYKDQKVRTASDLYVPTGTQIHVNLTSDDVIHSFWVPSLFGKMDANPGLTNKMHFSVDKPGVYYGKCAELCGPSHALMDFRVVAVSPDQFDKWTKEMKKGKVKPQTALAKQGQQVFNKECLSCHAIGGNNKGAGPNLNNFGNRTTIAGILDHNKKNLKAWIHDAPSLKADVTMSNFSEGSKKLSDQQLDALVEYLSEQKVDVKVPGKAKYKMNAKAAEEHTE